MNTGRVPSAPGSCPSGEATQVSSSQSDCDPSRVELDWFNECAREIGRLPDDWQWFKLEVIGKHPNTQGVMVTGAVSHVLIEKGPRKGEPNWKHRDKATEQQVFVAHGAMDARKDRYETETGVCHRCFGSGKVVQSVSIHTGATYRTCSRCDGTGRAPAQAIEVRRTETQGGSACESAVSEADAPSRLRAPVAVTEEADHG